MIKCEIIPLKEYSWSHNEKTKLGKYHGSYFWNIPGFGTKKWIAGINIKYENEENIKQIALDEKANQCFEYIKHKRPSFRKFEIYQSKEIDNGIIQLLMIVDKPKSLMFWGKGQRGTK